VTAMRRLCAPVLALLVPLAGCASAGGGDSAGEIRVLVYNIHAGRDASGAPNLERVAELVRATRADIVFLQEVDRGTERSGGEDQPAILHELTGHQVAFGRTLDYQGGEYGIAVLSRWPITENAVRPLIIHPPQARAGGSYEPRGALIARTDGPHGTIRLLDTHLDASGDDRYRLQEVRQVRALADSIRAIGGDLVLVAGDFNAEPESDVIRTMLDEGWRDAWAVCGGAAGYTYPSAEPVKRIDYLFLPPDRDCISAEVIPTATSDHRPILVVLGHRT
jgi:endonuclease/exonuclease/phosphatase family metal-dependent hydrolase